MKTLLLITDAWHPQTNGVVTTLARVTEALREREIATEVIHPGLFRTLPLPGYAEIRLGWNLWHFGRRYRALRPDYVHIATEGPLGWMARHWLLRHRVPFTTSLHTRFPEYLQQRLPWIPTQWGYRLLRYFHRPARATLITTASFGVELRRRGFDHLIEWGRGVDTQLFAPSEQREHAYRQPLMLYVGRVAVEKNLHAFLALRQFGKKVVVGDGPCLERLRHDYPEVLFTGYQYGEALADWYRRADVFVFPSRTDTFGLVMLEALACGTPVAAYPVTGPVDIVRDGYNGALDEDLEQAIKRALKVPREQCRESALRRSWPHCAAILAETLVPVNGRTGARQAA